MISKYGQTKKFYGPAQLHYYKKIDIITCIVLQT